jgi:hypothetical protein
MSDSYSGKWNPIDDQVGQNYVNVCNFLAQNLNGFKRHPCYCTVVGNDLRDRETAVRFFNYLKENSPRIFEKIDLFRLNDSIGNPNIYDIDGISISPGTLRYLRVLHDIIELDPTSILEIGGGYGGQALVTKLYNNNIDYSIVDIPEAKNLQESYLNTVLPDNNITLISTDNIDTSEEYDLMLSDYCISEFNEEGVDFYIDVAKKCKTGYFTINSTGKIKDYLLEKLKEVFNTVDVKDEYPLTSTFRNVYAICKK